MDNVFREPEGRFTNLMKELRQERTMILAEYCKSLQGGFKTIQATVGCKLTKKGGKDKQKLEE